MNRELRAAMRRHPAGKKLPTSHTSATILPFRPVRSMTTATAENTDQEGKING